MNAQELRKVLEESSDKLSIFADRSILSQYKFNLNELTTLVNEFLDNDQKAELLKLEHSYKLTPFIKTQIIKLISDDTIKTKMFENSNIMTGITSYQIVDIVDSLGEQGKMEILRKPEFFKEHDIKKIEMQRLIESLSSKNKQELMSNRTFIEQKLQLDSYQIKEIVTNFETEEIKAQMIDIYEFKKDQIVDIIKTFSDKSKTAILLEDRYKLYKNNIEKLVSTYSIDSLMDFFRDNKEFLAKNDIKPYHITTYFNKEKQLEFVSRMENISLSTEEKRKILATLRQETKNDIDISNVSLEQVTAIEMQIGNNISDFKQYGKIILDFNGDLERYRGLDELIVVNPTDISDEDKPKFLQLCEICPTIKISDKLQLAWSTVEEYTNAELWIESVLEKTNEQWTDIQKVAFIDNAIGKKISYSPDFDTEIFNNGEARALWKIINSGEGVCNGIAQIEKYILDKVGVESEIVSSSNHSFLKLKNIEILNKDEKVRGDTVLDPTWNLMAHKYGAKPENFCRSYEEIRKHDIKKNGTDTGSHKNDEALASATLNLDEQKLRQVFTSIGLADREGFFPIRALIDKAKSIDEQRLPAEEAIKKQLSLLEEYYPEFATCQNSTAAILKEVILNQTNLVFDKCIVNRVYARDDEKKRPVLYVYADLPEAGKKIYLADKDTKQFLETPQKEFESRFECYEMDMEKQGGYRHWEDVKKPENLEDLIRSSEKVIAQEGEEI